MDCRETQERVLERFDGAVAPLETRQLEAHIAECPECAQFAALQSQIDLRLREQIACGAQKLIGDLQDSKIARLFVVYPVPQNRLWHS